METLLGKLYYLDLKSSHHVVNLVACNIVWHQRLAHVNHATIKRMASEQLVTGADLSYVSVGICTPCIKGKMTQKPFKYKDQIKSTGRLQLIHSDVCGPMQNASIGGSRYFVTFIDDYRRFTHVHQT